jgi:hypothetical protein
MTTLGLIPRDRLALIPRGLQVAHEYSFFLHDECTRLLCEYEALNANIVRIRFPSKAEATRFGMLAKGNPIDALRKSGYSDQAKRVILNQITMALTSDFLHHVFEGLKCLEKRKIVVAFNVLRKPLKDNLAYLCWILADSDDFYRAFTTGNPEEIAQKKLGNKRLELFNQALAKTELKPLLDAARIHEILYSPKCTDGFEMLFQHAVHLVTTMHVELKTTPENLNFIFKSLGDDDLYDVAYYHLPGILLFASHIIFGAFRRMHPGDKGGHKAAAMRSILGFRLVQKADPEAITGLLAKALNGKVECPHCSASLRVTDYNSLRIVLTESFRCTACRRTVELPFSWIF